MSDQTHPVPAHIAIIMDGNGRWARSRGLPRSMGHRAGAEAARRIVEAAVELGVRVLTLYTFSSENWDRPKREIDLLMKLLVEFLRREAPTLHGHHVRLRAIGRTHELPAQPRATLQHLMDETAHYDRMQLVLALSYGGRQELVDAVRRVAEQVRDGQLSPQAITELDIARQLYAPDVPDPDLLVRTSGEMRLSNFLLWQSSYAELYVTPTRWPDFAKADLEAAIIDYQQRERRFGKVEVGVDESGHIAR